MGGPGARIVRIHCPSPQQARAMTVGHSPAALYRYFRCNPKLKPSVQSGRNRSLGEPSGMANVLRSKGFQDKDGKLKLRFSG